MALIDDFKARFTEFSTSDIDTYLPNLILEYPFFYGGDYEADIDKDKTIILYLLAHMLVGEIALQSSSAPDQTLTGGSVGNVSESYQTIDVGKYDAYFMTTRYGRRYLQLLNGNIGARWV